MLTEDLAALEILTEDVILHQLRERLERGEYHTFVGDILLILNPNEERDIYGAYVSLMLDHRLRSVICALDKEFYTSLTVYNKNIIPYVSLLFASCIFTFANQISLLDIKKSVSKRCSIARLQ